MVFASLTQLKNCSAKTNLTVAIAIEMAFTVYDLILLIS